MEMDLLYADLSFARSCKYSSAITNLELQNWIYYLIETYDNLPTFIFDLIEVNLNENIFLKIPLLHAKFIIDSLNNSEHRALYGIAYKRGFYSKDNPCELCTEKTALKNLENNPHILERFKQTFPFIKLEWAE